MFNVCFLYVPLCVGLFVHCFLFFDERLTCQDWPLEIKSLLLYRYRNSFSIPGDPPRTVVAEGPYLTVQYTGHETMSMFVENYKWGEYIGCLSVLFNDNGTVIDFNGGPIKLNDTVKEGRAVRRSSLFYYLSFIDKNRSQLRNDICFNEF